jgi:hypothetical protein
VIAKNMPSVFNLWTSLKGGEECGKKQENSPLIESFAGKEPSVFLPTTYQRLAKDDKSVSLLYTLVK